MEKKGGINVNSVSDEQGFKFIKEALGSVLDKDIERDLKLICDRILNNYINLKKNSNKWDLVLDLLTDKQKTKLLEKL